MMLVKREDTKVVVKIDLEVPDVGFRSFPFRFEAGQIEYAGFIKQALQKALADMDQQSYEIGRADAEMETERKVRRIQRKLEKAAKK